MKKIVDSKRKCIGFSLFFLAFVLFGMLIYVPIAQSKAQTEGMEGIESTSEPDDAEKPADTPFPSSTPNGTAKPKTSPKPTVEPTKAPSLMKAVSGVKLRRYSTSAVKVTWEKHKKAKLYRVYRTKKNGSTKLIGTTKKTQFMAKKLKNNTIYYFHVVAYTSKKASALQSKPSKKVCIKTKTYTRKTIFAGDSICQGIGYYTLPQIHIGGIKKVVAYRGLNTVTFHTKKIFNGKTGLQKIISEKPYRVYMMLGMNEIYFRETDTMIAEYEDMIQAIQKETPNTDIVLCAISPVTSGEQAKRPGFGQITDFNDKLKKLAKQTGTTYFDYTGFLKDSNGYLNIKYAEGDGCHWKPAAYVEFGKVVEKFDKSLDK